MKSETDSESESDGDGDGDDENAGEAKPAPPKADTKSSKADASSSESSDDGDEKAKSSSDDADAKPAKKTKSSAKDAFAASLGVDASSFHADANANADESEKTKKKKRDPFDAVRASWGFPAFAKDFPRHPELDELVAAFARGDYAAIRERAPKLAAASTDDDAVKRSAEKLRERIEPDPTSRILFLFAAALLAFLTLWWVAHDGPGGEKGSGSGSAAPMKSAPKPVPTVEHIN